MRATFIILAAFAAIALALGNPLDFDEQSNNQPQFDDQLLLNNDETFVRNKRFTCDFLQSTPACAAHCVARGFRGGWCDNRSVCNCRR